MFVCDVFKKLFKFQEENQDVDTAAMAAQKLGDGDISSDEGVNEKAADEAAAGTSAGGCDFDMVIFFIEIVKRI